MRTYPGDTQSQAKVFYPNLDAKSLTAPLARDSGWESYANLHLGYIQNVLHRCKPEVGIQKYLKFWKGGDIIPIDTVWRPDYKRFLSNLRKNKMISLDDLHELRNTLKNKSYTYINVKPGVGLEYCWAVPKGKPPTAAAFAPKLKTKIVEGLTAIGEKFQPATAATVGS
jgi:hypothetical protein